MERARETWQPVMVAYAWLPVKGTAGFSQNTRLPEVEECAYLKRQKKKSFIGLLLLLLSLLLFCCCCTEDTA